ncbi:stAR- lipid transfer, partial [Branchiostoma belcheri]
MANVKVAIRVRPLTARVGPKSVARARWLRSAAYMRPPVAAGMNFDQDGAKKMSLKSETPTEKDSSRDGDKELDARAQFIIQINENTTSVTNIKLDGTQEGYGDTRDRLKHFVFDYSYWSVDQNSPDYAAQEQIFQDLGTDVLASAFEGYNACVFAYGQTGTGKTYTMMETLYLEIYNERVRDLLCHPGAKANTYSLKVREHPEKGPYVQDLSRHLVSDYTSLERLIQRGNENRTTAAATYIHDLSSRSHAIFTIYFSQAKLEDNLPREIVSKIHLVDLAGSERADPNYHKDRLKEGANINRSLVTLGTVISAL